MRCSLAKIVIIAACAAASAAVAAEPRRALDCNVGPIRKTYGKTDWFVLSCTDRRTVMVYSMPDNPSSPYYFIWIPKPRGGVQLYAQGIGDAKAASAALKELRAMSEKDVAALIKETQTATTGSVR